MTGSTCTCVYPNAVPTASTMSNTGWPSPGSTCIVSCFCPARFIARASSLLKSQLWDTTRRDLLVVPCRDQSADDRVKHPLRRLATHRHKTSRRSCPKSKAISASWIPPYPQFSRSTSSNKTTEYGFLFGRNAWIYTLPWEA